MNRAIMMLVLITTLALVVISCKNDEQGATQGEAVVSGTVTDGTSSAPLAGVTVTAQTTSSAPQSKVTDATGTFRFSFTTDSTKAVTLSFAKSGYRDTTFIVQVAPGNVAAMTVPMSSRLPITGGTGSGIASTIAFISAQPQEVAVYGVGGNETSYLQWEVRDSLGLPIDAAHAVVLAFRISSGPGGGEYLSPVNVTTNAQGRVINTFSSGVRSGVAQIVASTVVGSRTIASSPVRVVIHAGLPDQAHFTIAPERHNFPTLGVVGNRDLISVLIGDKYSNPVIENTAVYFRSYAGVIQARVFTNRDGEGSTALISGNPQPFGQYAAQPYGDAYHWALAQTVGENAASVKDSTLILWSGRSQVSNFSPTSFNVPNGGTQTVNFRVSDALGHPLARGTT
ncbi:MAG: carboxypeptidase-like regulatory domain-containing protein, partial [Bacteroidota bacterium]